MKIADKLLEYIKNYGDKRIKNFYFGDPLTIPVSNLPAIIVSKKLDRINQGATGLDEIDKTYSIKLVFNKKDELGKNPNEVTIQRTMADLIEGTDSSNNWLNTSLIGILRKYFTLGDTINDQNIDIEYSLAQRGDIITEEAELTINIKDFVNVPNRS